MSQYNISLIALKNIIVLLVYFYLAKRGGIHIIKKSVYIAKRDIHLIRLFIYNDIINKYYKT